ncbi:TonB-dependent receptor plug domain-containing protein [Deferrisoma sp.]
MPHGNRNRRPAGWFRGACLGLILFVSCPPAAWAEGGKGLAGLSLEELLSAEVTTVSRRAELLSDAAAAVTVITAEDIRRSGVTSVPEALRLVPGVQVARIDANKWAVSARGFNGRFANKLLVLVDGRTVYTPLFSGVHWDAQDLLLEDIDRIEVIRGPGATLWGANAVNGVVNIVTRHAKDTQGTLVSVGGGNEEPGFLNLRQGFSSGSTFGRVWARAFGRDGSVDTEGREAHDAWQGLRGGWRLDGGMAGASTWTFEGEAYHERVQSRTRALVGPDVPLAEFDEEDPVRGAYVLARWNRWFSPTAQLSVQAYYDRTDRGSEVLGEVRDTWDLDLQHRFTLAGRHEIVWGLGARLTRDHLDGSYAAEVPEGRRTDRLWSAFAQDEIDLVPGRLRLTLGSKFERNDYTGTEVQPNARALWVVAPRHRLWAAVSRAVRTPSRAEADIRFRMSRLAPTPEVPVPVEVHLVGNEEFGPETLTAYELGYRGAFGRTITADAAAYCHVYRDLRTVEPVGGPAPGPEGVWVQEMTAGDRMRGTVYGAEVEAGWQPTPWWRLRLAYTWTVLRLTPQDGSRDRFSENAEGETPRNQVSLVSSWDLPAGWELDLWVRHVAGLPNLDVGAYTTADLRIGWQPTPGLVVSLVGQNLLDAAHPEFTPDILSTVPAEVERSVYARVTWSR